VNIFANSGVMVEAPIRRISHTQNGWIQKLISSEKEYAWNSSAATVKDFDLCAATFRNLVANFAQNLKPWIAEFTHTKNLSITRSPPLSIYVVIQCP